MTVHATHVCLQRSCVCILCIHVTCIVYIISCTYLARPCIHMLYTWILCMYRAARNGHIWAMFAVATCHFNGAGLNKILNQKMGFRWMLVAANKVGVCLSFYICVSVCICLCSAHVCVCVCVSLRQYACEHAHVCVSPCLRMCLHL
jgi:hypothetical protein